MHSILGLHESFSSSYPCRFCKINKNALKTTFSNDPNLMRKKQNYDEDIQLWQAEHQSTGIKDICVWHELSNFHLVNNYAVDAMHDLLEGICVYDITFLLRTLIIDLHLFSLEVLNNKINSFHYGYIDNINKPPNLTIE